MAEALSATVAAVLLVSSRASDFSDGTKTLSSVDSKSISSLSSTRAGPCLHTNYIYIMVDQGPPVDAQCPSYAVALGYMGVAAAVCLSNWGSAIGTWKSGQSIIYTGIRHPSSIMKNVIPIVMAGVIGIYGLIVGVIIGQSITTPSSERENTYSTFSGLAHLAAGLCTGCSGLGAGICIGIVGDYGVRAVGYRASAVTLFPVGAEKDGYSNIPDSEEIADTGGEDISGSEDQNKLFVGMLIMLIFSEALALYGMIVALIVSQNQYACT